VKGLTGESAAFSAALNDFNVRRLFDPHPLYSVGPVKIQLSHLVNHVMHAVKKGERKLADGGAEEVTTLQEAVIFSEQESYR